MASTVERLVMQINTVYDTTGEQSMAIVTREFVKDYLGITTSVYDTKIDVLIPLVEQTYLDIRNVPFSLDGTTIVYPIGSDVTASEMIGFKINNSNLKTLGQIKQSESIDAYSVSFGDSLAGGISGYPKTIVSQIKRYCDGR